MTVSAILSETVAAKSSPLPPRSGGEGLGVGGASANSLLEEQVERPPTPNPSPPRAMRVEGGEKKCYAAYMTTTTEDIEKAVEQLAPRELARFRAWFEAFDAEQFDAAIARDISAGKLDAHADEALAAHRSGRSRDL
jgi:hypothetical protein